MPLDASQGSSAPSLPAGELLPRCLGEPALMGALGLGQWNRLIPQARAAGLLARLAVLAQGQGMDRCVPPEPRRHLEWALVTAERQAASVRWEVRQLQRALAGTGVPLVLLKGAAYLLAELPPARGRLYHDVDVMVPKAALAAVEGALMKHGWATTHHDAYDQRYYRRWMHELPPLQHVRRLTVLDVHHTILPETGRLTVDARPLLANAKAVPGWRGVHVLAPEDMVLHSATHLFHDGELEYGLRDLCDLDALLRHYGDDAGFWTRLTGRARTLGLQRPLFYALRYTRWLLETPVPWTGLEGGPGRMRLATADACFTRALRPPHADASDRWTPLARWLLFIRSHWLRMPPWLLLPHLVRKAWRRRGDE